ncbi:hypothetical protein J5N97_004021 [Dioscorea zingiberensis]|uniref:RanBP2-type domain-containing protein n=1 Tax=Dioscorea zingiberensis TaxID=325984 RepID=A0A9D5HQJ5_9LILI|nr:hypothetical protein J5N97_004021 [Dioscorea zingiberensis]
MSRYPGDWDCRSCQHLNFSRRDTCQRCGEPKIGGGGARVGSKSSDAKPGDWYCMCGTHNFASRPNCFTCGTYKTGCVVAAGEFDGYGYTGVPAGWKSGLAAMSTTMQAGRNAFDATRQGTAVAITLWSLD